MKNPLSTQKAVKECAKPTLSERYITYEDEEIEDFEGQIIKGDINDSIISELEGRTLCKTKNLENIDYLVKNRLPVVIALLSDSQEILKKRDEGFIIIMPESNQDVVDSIMQGFRISERGKVSLPVVVNVDNIVTEEVEIPSQKSIEKFLTNFNIPKYLSLQKPAIFGIEEKNQKEVQAAMDYTKNFIPKVADNWNQKFKRDGGLVEKYNIEKAEQVLITTGSNSMTVKEVAKKLNEKEDTNVGVLRIKFIRPWAYEEIQKSLKDKKVGVLDQITSLGGKGILYTDVKNSTDSTCISFISEDKLLSKKEIKKIFKKLNSTDEEETFFL